MNMQNTLLVFAQTNLFKNTDIRIRMFWYVTSITKVTCAHVLFALMSIHETISILGSFSLNFENICFFHI